MDARERRPGGCLHPPRRSLEVSAPRLSRQRAIFMG